MSGQGHPVADLSLEQMLANGGMLFGNRLLSPRSVATMSSNQVGELFQSKGTQPGCGFGYGVAVVLDPAAANSARGQGAFGWGRAFGTTTWTDPAQETTARAGWRRSMRCSAWRTTSRYMWG